MIRIEITEHPHEGEPVEHKIDTDADTVDIDVIIDGTPIALIVRGALSPNGLPQVYLDTAAEKSVHLIIDTDCHISPSGHAICQG